MNSQSQNDPPMSLCDGMKFGALWSFASVGWIATILLIMTWLENGASHALFWFGIAFLIGSPVFAIAFLFSLLCELLNVTAKKSRRDALNYFAWAFAYNSLIGGGALLLSSITSP
jgi:hypothetical protein